MFGNSIKMDLNVKKEGFLWLSEENYKNWRAYLNGRQVKLNQTRANFLSLFVPKGKSELVLKYRYVSTRQLLVYLSLIFVMLSCYILFMYTNLLEVAFRF